MPRLSAEQERLHQQYVVAHRVQITRRYATGETPAQMSRRYGVSASVLRRMLKGWLESPDGREEVAS